MSMILKTRFSSSSTCYELPISTSLIQAIRAYQAIAESGISVYAEEEDRLKFEHLEKLFRLKIIDKKPKKLVTAKNLSISHSEPFVKVGSSQRILLFPKSVVKECKRYWHDQREYDFLFVGLMTDSRLKVINKWRSQLNFKSHNDVKLHIKNSSKGRTFPNKAWDEDYFSMLGNARFVLCPNGDFTWTYRFFESLLCGAIPIVEDSCPAYEGFKFYSMQDPLEKLVYSKDFIDSNYQKAIESLTMPRRLIKKELKSNLN